MPRESNLPTYDLDHDGKISDQEIARVKAIMEVENLDDKQTSQRQMAWVALISMVGFTLAVFLPIFPDSRIIALADLFGLFYIGQAGVVGAYMGMSAYMSAKR
tara:strand:- start:338 stop:646 length:309 start_codon:yes stop_codon:yes gene_type:complete